MRISWSSFERTDLHGEEIFFVELQHSGPNIPELKIASHNIAPEVYSGDLETFGIVLEFLVEAQAEGLSLLQNVPNPFSDETAIAFNISSDEVVDFRITDMGGNTVYQTTRNYRKGTNTIRITSSDLGSSGVFYYTITTATDKKTMRLILLH